MRAQTLVQDLVHRTAESRPDATALLYRSTVISYAELSMEIQAVAKGLRVLGLPAGGRVAIYLPKQPETVCGIFGAAAAGGAFVPINPVLKAEQVGYILRDCNAHTLITSTSRLDALTAELSTCPDLQHVVLVDGTDASAPVTDPDVGVTSWDTLRAAPPDAQPMPRRIDTDMVAILYTSGSTGMPKGVVLSHRNLVAGAESVAEYLNNSPDDRLLAVLPLSFDYGLSQLTTAFRSGGSVVLMDYLLPRDVIRSVARFGVTGLACVPPLWNQLCQLEWPVEAGQRLRYITSSGGAMPRSTLDALRKALPETEIFLMYGLTEAFRSTYLPPAELHRRPGSMGHAIPNAEVLVVREDGTECEPEEVGELVHRGALVALGYWNAPERTAARFRPAPGQPAELPNPEMAVWSGDRVWRDADGYLYFVGRNDEMIKSSGYRISPAEIEEVAHRCSGVAQAVALGVPHPTLGEGVVLVVQTEDATLSAESVSDHCRKHLPQFMVPHAVHLREVVPRNANGKIDRTTLREEFRNGLTEQGEVSA